MRRCLTGVLALAFVLAVTYIAFAEEVATQQAETAVSQETGTVPSEEVDVSIDEPLMMEETNPVFEEGMAPEEENAVNNIYGEVVSLDTTNSTLIVKYLSDVIAETYEEITIKTDEFATIEKDNIASALSEILVGEKANITYTTDEDGTNLASSISIETQTQP